jgi:hypothetical protein
MRRASGACRALVCLFASGKKAIRILPDYQTACWAYLTPRASGQAFGRLLHVPRYPLVPAGWRFAMKSTVTKLVAALGLASALALSATTVSFAQNQGSACIPQYDTSGAQKAPYC